MANGDVRQGGVEGPAGWHEAVEGAEVAHSRQASALAAVEKNARNMGRNTHFSQSPIPHLSFFFLKKKSAHRTHRRKHGNCCHSSAISMQTAPRPRPLAVSTKGLLRIRAVRTMCWRFGTRLNVQDQHAQKMVTGTG